MFTPLINRPKRPCVNELLVIAEFTVKGGTLPRALDHLKFP